LVLHLTSLARFQSGAGSFDNQMGI